MRADEFTSTKFTELDAYLIELCALVIRGQRTDSDEYGMTVSYRAVGMTFADFVWAIVESAIKRG